MSEKEGVVVFDFGSQYSQLIVRKIRELGFFARLVLPEQIDSVRNPSGVVLSGGPKSVSDPDAPDIDVDRIRNWNVPVLGICYGMQILNCKLGGKVAPGHRREYGPAELLTKTEDTLFRGVRKSSQVWMSHSDTVTELPRDARVLAVNAEDVPVAVQWDEKTFGIQFHPEVTHSEEGKKILSNFLATLGYEPDFSMASLKNKIIGELRQVVAERTVVCAVSGGVDSTVLAALLHQAGIPMHAIFVDTGLLRKGEKEEVVRNFNRIGIEIDAVDSRNLFLEKLKNVVDPEEKRKIIGDTFLDVFFRRAGDIELFAQGTLYPDVIESATSGSDASRIKTHHNRVDRILDLKKQGKVIEPLGELFKDEVRALGRELGIPGDILGRHPFPGPGLAVRIPGEVVPDRLELLREADAILIEELKRSGWYERIWQALCVLLPVKTVGVKGDERSFENALSIRCVVSQDAMTADWVELPPALLRRISNRILNEVTGVNRVLYDISTKPPASIEWE